VESFVENLVENLVESSGEFKARGPYGVGYRLRRS
jgi:hypothetical protein